MILRWFRFGHIIISCWFR